MNDRDIPEGLKKFIIERIDSIGQLEVLFLLAQNPNKNWNAESLSHELRSTEASAEKHLDDLSKQKLIHKKSEKEYLFKPESDELEACVKELIQYYSTYHHRVIALIYDKPIERIKGFADAFRIRKEPKDG